VALKIKGLVKRIKKIYFLLLKRKVLEGIIQNVQKPNILLTFFENTESKIFKNIWNTISGLHSKFVEKFK